MHRYLERDGEEDRKTGGNTLGKCGAEGEDV